MTAREAAKQLIRYEVLNGWTIDQLAKSYSGVCGSDYKAQIGGYMWRDADLLMPDGKPFKHLNNYQIGVERVGKVEVMEVFSLKEIYNEIVLEKQTGRKEQLTLF
ncbi:MAG TPA: hypothetical protein VEP90_03815 [Methylomirabilota bacterium]|nr:hypothetical protein [Methylomirabilota bacterium]